MFTPTGSGTYTFILKATDACGATDYDTSVANVTLNQAPVANAGRDTTLSQCTPAAISIAANCSDPDGNLSTCQLTSGPGTYNGTAIVFTPTGSGTYTFILKATDACGETDYDTSIAHVTINQAPVANAGADQNLTCQALGQQICWTAGCSDPDNDLATCQLVSGTGTYSGGQICFNPTASGSYQFVLKATDACGATDYDTAVVNVRINVAPTLNVAASDTTIFCQQSGVGQVCVAFNYSDADVNLKQITASGSPTPTLSYGGGNGTICFNPTAGGNFSFTLTALDSCGLQTQVSHNHFVTLVDCDTISRFAVKVQKTHNSLQGQYEFVSVTITGDGADFGGFDFLLSYDASALTAMEVQPGQMLTSCDWEYFTYRFGANGNCGGPCPSGLLRIVSIADVNNGAHHPSCYGPAIPSSSELFKVKFFVTNDRTFDCQYAPVKFFWMDCGDNSISSVTGDTLFVDKRIYLFEGQTIWDELDDAQYPDGIRPNGMGAPDECMLGDKYHPSRSIEFRYGGVDIVCADSIDARGDLNLNGIANEISDAVLYTNYFLYGISAFYVAPRQEAQVAASDVNADGRPLTVGDLVFLIRIITGDALPIAKLAPFAQEVVVHYDGNSLSTESSTNIGAMLLTFRTNGECSFNNLTDLTLKQTSADGELKVLVYDISAKSIAAGLSHVLRVDGDAVLESVEIADYQGNLMLAKIDKSAVPTEFALGQNYPNPFNPETVIEFALPTASEMSLTVYNIAGQTVATIINGTVPAGYHQVRWNGKDDNGTNASSGIYFYKIVSKDFSETRKMLLIK